MTDEGLDLEGILAYIAEELEDDGDTELLAVLRQSTADYNWSHDDWDVNYWKITLSVPRKTYRTIKNKIDSYQEELLARAQEASRSTPKNGVSGIFIVSVLPQHSNWRDTIEQPVAIIEAETDQMWTPGLLRLFISHKSDQKAKLARLKEELLLYGIDSFLAHEEIRPTKKWRDMIQQGLQSCHGVLAVSTTGFQASAYCMQEVGWGLARGVLVLPVLAGEPPAGFHAEHQGPSVNLQKSAECAQRIANALCEDNRTRELLFKGLAERFRRSGSGQETAYIWRRLEKLQGCPHSLIGEIERAFLGNEECKNSTVAAPKLPVWIAKQRGELRGVGTSIKESNRAPDPDENTFDPFADE